ncbi:peptide deformylase [Sphingobacterium spiritivorum]|uniref:Peptide deformylase n=2 Tax=Sphingobacterium spiritivorum TaxID=258 RepID=D7VTR1_SPHSI|nr:peptide deformylase [Sphingobacterium spiritivorum]EFK55820.1 peptide deformylase [Sphingobacterium spiritivorum ATCC 33861]QQT37278.1 peptide deformylase [Sphingobacterium spiritivorum]WQD34059.1 peptide deformylase [Sphingobacterium spiritivorum]SUJ16328.1 Peptide deformylase [Sphingobacterium spiritivorum]SUJ29361.1 Peptide deformylase [Sphingobacterium spiritivorum]
MKLPIVAYGDPVLRKKTIEIDEDYPEIKELIANMYDTMYAAHGVGLAAPQIGLPIRVFVIDASPFAEDDDEDKSLKDFKKVFINPIIVEETGEKWGFNEGCLSIPDINEEVFRPANVVINYLDENFEEHEIELSGLAARIVQHEYDHLEGKLFTDKLGPLKKAMLKGKLDAISKGLIRVGYKMKFPFEKKKR